MRAIFIRAMRCGALAHTGRQRLFHISGLRLLILAVALVVSVMHPLDETCADNLKRPVRIGVLTDSWGPPMSAVGLRDGLETLGYQEGRDYVLGVRFTQGNSKELPTAARELVAHGVDLIFTGGGDQTAKAAQLATTQIPIVFSNADDPIGQGLIQTFAHPGGNITGIADLALELGPKRLELFKEMIPAMRRVLYLYDATETFALKQAKSYRHAAQILGIDLIEQPVNTSKEARDLLIRIQPGEVDGILPPVCCSLNIPGAILDIIPPKRIPTMFNAAFWTERGAFASYGQDFYEMGRQSARLVDKILKGKNPGDIPVEVNSKIDFVINLKAAKAMSITLAPVVLFQANRIIR